MTVCAARGRKSCKVLASVRARDFEGLKRAVGKILPKFAS
jgi:hypothetical protein